VRIWIIFYSREKQIAEPFEILELFARGSE